MKTTALIVACILLAACHPQPQPKTVTETQMLRFENQQLKATSLRVDVSKLDPAQKELADKMFALGKLDSERNTLLSEICGDIPLSECAIKTDVKPWTVERVKPAPAKPVKK